MAYESVSHHPTSARRVYRDGVEHLVYTEPALGGDYASVTTAFAIGGYGADWLFGGVDEFKIYSRALPPYDVAANYRGTEVGWNSRVGLLAYYSCNEQTGMTLYDVSGNGNHLTASVMTSWSSDTTDIAPASLVPPVTPREWLHSFVIWRNPVISTTSIAQNFRSPIGTALMAALSNSDFTVAVWLYLTALPTSTTGHVYIFTWSVPDSMRAEGAAQS